MLNTRYMFCYALIKISDSIELSMLVFGIFNSIYNKMVVNKNSNNC